MRNANPLLMRFPKASYKYLPAFAVWLTGFCSAAGPEVPLVLAHKEGWKKPQHSCGNGIWDAAWELVERL